jgi:hypothetical protein
MLLATENIKISVSPLKEAQLSAKQIFTTNAAVLIST